MSEITSIPPSVAAGLVRARRAVKAVEKQATNTHQKYKYASADAIMAEALSALSEAGLTFSTLAWAVGTVERQRSIATEGGEIVTVPEVGLRLRCTHVLAAEDGACVVVTTDDAILPQNGRPEDKATFGTLTESYAYALRGLLGIPRVDESISVSGRDDTRETTAPAARRAPPAARPLAPPANDAPAAEPAKNWPAAWPPPGSVTGERGAEEQRLAGIVAAAETSAAAEAAWGACKASLDAGAISKDVARRLHEAYKARRDALATAPAAGAAQ